MNSNRKYIYRKYIHGLHHGHHGHGLHHDDHHGHHDDHHGHHDYDDHYPHHGHHGHHHHHDHYYNELQRRFLEYKNKYREHPNDISLLQELKQMRNRLDHYNYKQNKYRNLVTQRYVLWRQAFR